MDYSFEVVSRQDKNILRPYFIDGVDTIGVMPDEPFSLRFTNRTNKAVQVRVAIDGTDILTGEKAAISTSGKMWLVEAHGKLELSAWPETNEGGASFLFGTVGTSVAKHTHGDLKQKGILAAAVFTESYVAPPQYVAPYVGVPTGPQGPMASPGPMRYRTSSMLLGANLPRARMTKSANYSAQMSMDYSRGIDIDDSGANVAVAAASPVAMSLEEERTKSIENAPAVGAGETIKQELVKGVGLRQPKFDRVISIRYLWWDHLRAKLANYKTGTLSERPTGFFNHDNPMNINLTGVPRQEVFKSIEASRTF